MWYIPKNAKMYTDGGQETIIVQGIALENSHVAPKLIIVHVHELSPSQDITTISPVSTLQTFSGCSR